MKAFSRRLQFTTQANSAPGSGAPATPQNVTATADDSKATLWWTTTENTTGYDVEYRVSPAGGWQSFPHSGMVTHVIITGLTNGTAYDFRVRATDGGDVSAWSAIVSNITPVAANNVGGGLPMQLDTVFVNY